MRRRCSAPAPFTPPFCYSSAWGWAVLFCARGCSSISSKTNANFQNQTAGACKNSYFQLSFCSMQAKSEKGRGMERRGINGRIKLFLPLAPAGSCPYSGEGLTAKQASYSLTACLNPVLSPGGLHLLDLNNSLRHQGH